MDSDEVNSISDTVEAQQVANVIKTSYEDLVSYLDLPERFTLFQLNDSGDPDLPVVMYRPAGISRMLWLKYDCQTTDDTTVNYREMKYLAPQDFLDQIIPQAQQDDTVEFNVNDMRFFCWTDRAPTYWTSFDDYTIIFDSIDLSVDTTLQQDKTLCYGKQTTDFLLEDGFIPPLDEDKFSLLFNEAKAMCFAELKQTEHKRAEKKVRQGMVKSQIDKMSLPYNYPMFNRIPDYGRRR